MKTRLIGWKDVAGKSDEVIVCAESVPTSEQSRIFHEAKANQNFPKGIQRLSLQVVDNESIAIYLGDEAAKQVQARAKAAAKQQAEAAAVLAAARKHEAEVESAQHAFNDAKNHLISAIARKSAMQRRLDDSKANFAATQEDKWQRAADNAQTDLDKATKDWTAAVKAQEDAEKALSKIKNKS